MPTKSWVSAVVDQFKRWELPVIPPIRTIKFGEGTILFVAIKGELYLSKFEGEGGYPGMAERMHNDVYYLPPENTQFVVIDVGEIKGISHVLVVLT